MFQDNCSHEIEPSCDYFEPSLIFEPSCNKTVNFGLFLAMESGGGQLNGNFFKIIGGALLQAIGEDLNPRAKT